jgi:adenylate cyclase
MEPEEAVVLYNVACTYALLGETDKALDCLEKAFRQGYGHKEWFERDPDFSSVRDHPRFQTLMQQLSVDRSKAAL